MEKTQRLTARSPKNNMAYLVGVKPNEQELEGSYDTLMCVRAAFERLATYEDMFQNVGQISDGDHTFDELYHHRMVLFAVICRTYPAKAWRSFKHADGSMYKDYFIVGITTPEGDYSYHYHQSNWSYFNGITELDNAPEWDGHKPSDIDRLMSLL